MGTTLAMMSKVVPWLKNDESLFYEPYNRYGLVLYKIGNNRKYSAISFTCDIIYHQSKLRGVYVQHMKLAAALVCFQSPTLSAPSVIDVWDLTSKQVLYLQEFRISCVGISTIFSIFIDWRMDTKPPIALGNQNTQLLWA